jgi:hypothetical protein
LGGRIEGTIVEAKDKHAIPTCRVNVVGFPHSTITDERGRFAVDGLWSGSFSLEVQHPRGGRTLEFEITGQDTGVTRIAIELEPHGNVGSISLRPSSGSGVEDSLAVVVGEIVDESGEPLSLASVTLLGDGFMRLNNRIQVKRFTTRTGTNGRFAIRNVPPGNYDARAELWTHIPITMNNIDIGRGSHTLLRFELARPPGQTFGRIEGRITDAASGAPVPYANVFLAGTTAGAVSARDGSFSLDGIPSGTYVLRVRAMVYRRADQDSVVVRANRTSQVDVAATTVWSPHTANRTTEERSRCDVHDRRMEKVVLPISYGCGGGPDREYTAARATAFPNAESWWGRGGPVVVGPGGAARKVLDFICPECVDSRNRFLTDNRYKPSSSRPRPDWRRHSVGDVFSFSGPPDLEHEPLHSSGATARGRFVSETLRLDYDLSVFPTSIRSFRDERFDRFDELIGNRYALVVTNRAPVEIGGYAHVVEVFARFVSVHEWPLRVAVYAKDDEARAEALAIARSLEFPHDPR